MASDRTDPLPASSASLTQLPTFIMGIASIHPPLRSNLAFTSTFFITRIFLHIALLASSVTPHGRSAPHINGSWGVATSLIVTLPMHLWWGYKCILSVRRRMHKRKLAARVEREKEANLFANVAGQAFNGFGAPDSHSAVNTPLPTPAPSPVLAATVVPAAFKKAAAKVGRRPMQLVLGRSRSSGAVNEAEESPQRAATVADANGFLQVPPLSLPGSVTSPSSRRRTSFDSRRSSSEESVSGTAMRRVHSSPLTQPVPPPGATADSREPFLAIRSAAEGRDRARRLVADGVRRLWFGAPASWRRQFEEEAMRLDGGGGGVGPRRAAKSLAEASDADEEDDAESEATRSQRARALLRRGVLRAVRRTINGRGVEPTSDEGDEPDRAALRRSMDFSSLIKRLPPDLVGQPFEVRPMEVERREGQRRRSLVGELRRKMEIRATDVVVWG